MSEQITFTVAGKHRILGLWPHGSSGKHGELRVLAMEGRRAIEGFELSAATIRNDARRSALAQKEDTIEAAKDRLKELGRVQQRLNEKAAELSAERAKLTAITPYRDGDHATVAIDLALAAHMRDMDVSKRNVLLLSGNDQRALDAALRLPPALTGITPTFYRKIEKAAIERKHPREAQEAEDLAESIESAQEVLRRSFQMLAEAGGVSTADRVEAAGEYRHDLMPNQNQAPLDSLHRKLHPSDEEGTDEGLSAA